MITQELKEQLQELLENKKNSYSSQAEMARAIPNVSEANIINILKGRWDNISDKKWNEIASFLKFKKGKKWQIVPVAGFVALTKLFGDAREDSMSFGVVAQEGYGKTIASTYADEHKYVYRIECAEYFSKKLFLQEILMVMGLESTGTIGEMMMSIISHLNKLDQPLIIFDEVDKLSDAVLRFYITFYNRLKHSCGFILMATDHLRKRILKGVKLNKTGFKEIYTRIGRNFIELPRHPYEDVEKICKANGCYDDEFISKIYNEFQGDLNRVERMVYAYHKKSA